ncbi:hypothetical protein PCL_04417 [Purpureocillium lilacinum]|uniref:Uncharacterized protein n=1 Tax=Purpureocillium lilacinum TaxID=33203 RepID=A0A2U3DXC6_PURLI|nr:hypothetical protein Purlil1_2137 [Purpureocillium lilacinum]PWI66911.1 hypothetical protein PCL_04417 [Purpureocillium lilacinum]
MWVGGFGGGGAVILNRPSRRLGLDARVDEASCYYATSTSYELFLCFGHNVSIRCPAGKSTDAMRVSVCLSHSLMPSDIHPRSFLPPTHNHNQLLPPHHHHNQQTTRQRQRPRGRLGSASASSSTPSPDRPPGADVLGLGWLSCFPLRTPASRCRSGG